VDRGQQLVVYTNSGSNGRDAWLQERAAQEGYNLVIVQIPGGDLTNRIIAEKNNALADVVFGLNSVEFEKLKKQDLLMKYAPVWADEIKEPIGDPEGYYYPIVVQPLVLMYNNAMTDAPKDWTDLADPKYRDRYSIFGLGGGTSKTILASILVRYADPNGQYGISTEGWDIVKKYIQNAFIDVPGTDWVGNVISGVRPMSMIWGSGVIQNQNERNYEFGIMSPEVGVPFVVEQVAIISKTDRAALAMDFANWFGSKEVQQEWSAEFGSIPAHPGALASANDDVKAFMAKVNAQAIDWPLVVENLDKWVEKVELEFIK
jgi:iron(III) transport system substrate-binding protein